MIAAFLEHTLLKPTCSQSDIEQVTQESIDLKCKGVCVPPYWVKKVKRDIASAETLLVTVIGFPFGYQQTDVKAAEARLALEHGADEVDMVFNLSAWKTGMSEWAKADVARLAKICHEQEKMLKVILEIAYLSPDEIVSVCKLCADAGADFVKTSTGYAPSGATIEAVKLMRKSVPEHVGVKASGGIRDYAFAKALIEAGADRIGTSSSIKICQEIIGGQVEDQGLQAY